MQVTTFNRNSFLNHVRYLEGQRDPDTRFAKLRTELPQIKRLLEDFRLDVLRAPGEVRLLSELDLVDRELTNEAHLEGEAARSLLERISALFENKRPPGIAGKVRRVFAFSWCFRFRDRLQVTDSPELVVFHQAFQDRVGLAGLLREKPKPLRNPILVALLSGTRSDWTALIEEIPATHKLSGFSKKERNCLAAIIAIEALSSKDRWSPIALLREIDPHARAMIHHGNRKHLEEMERRLCALQLDGGVPRLLPDWLKSFPKFKGELKRYENKTLKENRDRLQAAVSACFSGGYPWPGLEQCLEMARRAKLDFYIEHLTELKTFCAKLVDCTLPDQSLKTFATLLDHPDIFAHGPPGYDCLFLRDICRQGLAVPPWQQTGWSQIGEDLKTDLWRFCDHLFYLRDAETVCATPNANLNNETPGLKAAGALLELSNMPESDQLMKWLQAIQHEWTRFPDRLRVILREQISRLIAQSVERKRSSEFYKLWSQVPQCLLSASAQSLLRLAETIQSLEAGDLDFSHLLDPLDRDERSVMLWLSETSKREFLSWLLTALSKSRERLKNQSLTRAYMSLLGDRADAERRSFLALLEVLLVKQNADLAWLKEKKRISRRDRELLALVLALEAGDRERLTRTLLKLDRAQGREAAILLADLKTIQGTIGERLEHLALETVDLVFFRAVAVFLANAGKPISKDKIKKGGLAKKIASLARVGTFLEVDCRDWHSGTLDGHQLLQMFLSLELGENEYWWLDTYDADTAKKIASLRKVWQSIQDHLEPYVKWLCDWPNDVANIASLDRKVLKNHIDQVIKIDQAYNHHMEKLASSLLITNIMILLRKEYARLCYAYLDQLD